MTEVLSSSENKSPAIIGGKKVPHNCTYCLKDISLLCQVKCLECDNAEFCTDCFCSGVEIDEHLNSHSYRLSDSLDFNLFSPDWTVAEELLLLDGNCSL